MKINFVYFEKNKNHEKFLFTNISPSPQLWTIHIYINVNFILPIFIIKCQLAKNVKNLKANPESFPKLES